MSSTSSSKALSSEEKVLAKGLQLMLIFEAGLAVAEMPQATKSQLGIWSLEQFNIKLNSVDLTCPTVLANFCGKGFKLHCRENFTEILKESIRERIKKMKNAGDHIWRKFGDTKSLLIKSWGPGFVFHSGTDEDDALENARRYAWSVANEKPPEEAPEVTLKNIPLEMFTFKKYRGHVFFKPCSMKKKRTNNDSEDDSSDNENDQEASIASQVKSRKQQRFAKKSKSVAQMKAESIMKRNVEVANQNVSARMHAEAMANKNKIEMLKLVQSTNLYSDDDLKALYNDAIGRMFPSVSASVTKKAHDDEEDERVSVERTTSATEKAVEEKSEE